MTIRQVLCGFAVIAFSVLSCGTDEPVRTWTDSTGKFKLQARFVSEEAGKVTLEKEDGSQLEIELSKLSAADQTAVAERKKAASENPFKAKEASPFKSISPPKGLTAVAPKAGPPVAGGEGAADESV